MILTYKRNKHGTVQAAHSGTVRIGYVEQSRIGNDTNRWIWSLNTIQPQGGRASGIAETEAVAKAALELNWVRWVGAAGLTLKEQQSGDLQDSDGFREAGEG